MIYINSKGEEEQLEEMNEFHLKAALAEFKSAYARDTLSDEAEHCVQIVIRNLEEVVKQFKPDWEKQIEKDFQLTSDQKKVKDLIAKYFPQ